MTRIGRAILVGGVLVWLATAVITWCGAPPLGHDEARYATDTRELLAGTHKRYGYVPVGMNAMATPGILLGGGERALRGLSVLAGLAFLLAAWRLARRATDDESAAWVVGVLAGARPITKYSADLLSDLPSAACLLAALAVLITELTREDGPRARLMIAAPLCAGGFYLRYGSAATIAIIAAAALVLGIRGVRRRPRWAIATATLFAALLVPYAVYSTSVTGSMLGILELSASVPGHGGGEGLVSYLTTNAFAFYGILVAPLMIAGLVLVHRVPRAARALPIIAVLQIVVLGMTTHAQARFVVVAIVLLVIVGVAALRTVLTSRLAMVAVLAVVAMWIGNVYATVHWTVNGREHDWTPTVLAARAIHTDAAGRSCAVLGRHTAQLEWYGGCPSTNEILVQNLALDTPVYAVGEPSEEPGQRCALEVPPTSDSVLRLQPLGTSCAPKP